MLRFRLSYKILLDYYLMCSGSSSVMGVTEVDDDVGVESGKENIDQTKRKFSSIVKNVMIANQMTPKAVLDQEDSVEIWPATAAWFLGPKVDG